MKKVLAVLIVLLMTCFAAYAEDFTPAVSQVEENWFELSANDTVLTVRLPGNTKTGLVWSYEISDPAALELITQETVIGESEGMAGTPTTFVASFMTRANGENAVSLILNCTYENEPGEAPVYTRVLELRTDSENRIRIGSVLEKEPFAEWCEYGDEGYTLTVRMPDGAWSHQILDEDVVELITCDDSDGTYVASFMATMESAGNASILFSSDDEMRSRYVDVFVNESGWMQVNWVETFEIYTEVEKVCCDVCGGWFEAGNVFRNHICISPTEPEAMAVEFRTVNITGGTVNVREGVGTGYQVVSVLEKGNNVRYMEECGWDDRGVEWYKVSFDNKTGWVSSQYAKLGGQGYVKVVNGSCNVRILPDLDADVIGGANQGTVLTYLGKGAVDSRGVTWYKVSINGKEGWMSSKYAAFTASAKGESKKEQYAYAIISGGSCTMRKAPNLNGETIQFINSGSVCTYLGEKSTDSRGVAWYKVSYNGKTGWVSSKFAKLSNTKPSTPSEPSKPSEPTDDGDMRLVYNPNRYDVLRVTDIYSQNGRDYYVTGCFGVINAWGEPEYFDGRKTVTMALVPGAEVMVPSDLNDMNSIGYVNDPAIWFNNARNELGGGSYSFYASFSMNESGALRNLVYIPVY